MARIEPKGTMWSYRKANFQVDWDQCLLTDNPNFACDTWTKKMVEVVTANIYHKEAIVWLDENHWYNGYLWGLSRSKEETIKCRLKTISRESGKPTEHPGTSTSRKLTI